MQPHYKRILLKLSGEALMGEQGYGIDYALLGVLMITLVAFQFFYRNAIIWKKIERET